MNRELTLNRLQVEIMFDEFLNKDVTDLKKLKEKIRNNEKLTGKELEFTKTLYRRWLQKIK